jgi:RNA polymerase subunit RPABC4/transcription elongation factor Spt4
VKGAYDTSLLESMAKRDVGHAKTEAIKGDIAEKTRALDDLVSKQKILASSAEQDERVRRLYALIAAVSPADRDSLRDDLRQLNFWFPVKRLGMQMIFLLPLLFAFYFWNARSIAARRPFQTLVSSHLVVIAFLPVLFKIVELVYDIIPKKLLARLFELLESLKLVALWHYFVIAISIVAALALIYVLQRKLFSRERLIDKRIAKGLCQNCGQRLPADSRACPLCGFAQYRKCVHCKGLAHALGRYCRECGKPLTPAPR